MTSGQKVFMWILIVLVIGLVGFIFYPYGKNLYQKYFGKTITPPTSDTSSQTTTPTPTETETVTLVSDPGVTWLSSPQKLDDLGLLKNPDSNKAASINEKTYYKVADLADGGELITAKVQLNEPSGPDLLRFKKLATTNGKYEYNYLTSLSSWQDYSTYSQYLTDKVSASNISYQSLSAPSYLTVKGGVLRTTNPIGSQFFSDLKNPKEIAQSEYGKIYQTLAEDQSPLAPHGATLNLKLPDSSIVVYSLKYDFMTDNEVALVTWKNGTANSAKYTSEGYVGCGSGASDNIITDTNNLSSRLIEAGKTNAGDKIYTVAATDEIMKSAYENYKIGRTKDILSTDAFVAKNPIFIWKNGFGDYVVFTGRDYAGLAECGKPVIYLYPQKTTNVSVKVGADITKSDPEYNNGWEAIAKSNGELTIAGVVYPYLFWEGTGQEYPAITSGKVVSSKVIEQTLTQDLADLGLNQKETADFLEFWLPKMPNTSYIRLTWFGTAQMNKLAPLAVSPKPDTMIRVFLDFEGLNEQINLPTQKLNHIERKGFTLVEWGGLLIGEK